MATRNLNFILSQMLAGDYIARSWRGGSAGSTAFLDDYASLILALLAHYQTDPSQRWFQAALDLSASMREQFTSQDGLFYDTPEQHEELLIRPRDVQDNATPSGNALAAHALLQLAAYQGDVSMRTNAEMMLGRMQFMAAKHPTAFSYWLCALDFAVNEIQEVAIIGEIDDDRTDRLISALWSRFRPDVVAAISPPGVAAPPPALLEGRGLLGDAPAAYVCRGFICQQPVTVAGDLLKQLAA
jgi:hypothetical protein